VSSDESTGEIIAANGYSISSNDNLENVWGLVRLNVSASDGNNDSNTIYGIKINI